MIFYFSGTGNSQYVANRIAEGTSDKVVSISDALNSGQCSFELAASERVGFVFPTYFFGVPSIVLDFLDKLKLQNYLNNYTFGVVTSGGDYGNLFAMLRRRLTKKGLWLDAAFDVEMPDNYILMFNLLTPPDRAAKMLSKAGPQTDAIVDDIIARKRVADPAGVWRSIKTAATYPIYNRTRKTGPFYADFNCTGCGLCTRICPCRMIEMHDRIPRWQEGKCTQCLACLHRCPTRAVQYGNKTHNRGRYVNPEIK